MHQKLGQHFLKNISAIKKIIAALDIKAGDTIIEIGPGRGALTFPLAEECAQKKCRLIAVEKDVELAQNLESKIILSPHPLCHSRESGNPEDAGSRIKCGMTDKSCKDIEIITGDALKILPKLLSSSEDDNIVNYKLVGNIPYYITGKLLRTISELENKPSISVLMVQKEVAERICAQPKLSLRVPPKQSTHQKIATSQTPRNDKTRNTSNGMNLLAAATQYWADPKIILDLKAKEFDPPPEVDSAVIRLKTKVVIPGLPPHASLAFGGTRNPEKKTGFQIGPALELHRGFGMTEGDGHNRMKKENALDEAEKYYKLIHIIFKQPRKTLANNLKDGLGISRAEVEKILNTLGLPLNSRPQDISVENILKLVQYLSKTTK